MTSAAPQYPTVGDFINPVLERLGQFNPGVPYDGGDVKRTLQRLIKTGRIEGISLLPDLNRIHPVPVKPELSKLLIAKCCEVYVDLVLEPRFGQRKRLPKHQKEFVQLLKNEIYDLENGDGAGFSVIG